MKKELSEHIAEIIETERRCRHETISCGPEDLSERYVAVLNTLLLIQEDVARGIMELRDMLNNKKVSPEALALILDYQGLAASPVRWWIEEFLKEADYSSALIFIGCLKENQVKKLDNSKEHIRRVVREHQDRNREVSPMFSGKGVVYTVVTGGYDLVHEPAVVDPNWDYVCISDSEDLELKTWKLLPYKDSDHLDPARMNRKAKLLPWSFLEGYDYSIYLDGNIRIIGDLSEYVRWYAGQCSMLCFPHPSNSCLSDELSAIKIFRQNQYQNAKRQAEVYLTEGYPNNYPMIQASVLLRNHHDQRLRDTMTCWWEEIKTKSARDQISFGYACWKNDYHYDLCELDIYDNTYFEVMRHGREKG